MPHLPRRSFLPLAGLAALARTGPAASVPPAPPGPQGPGRGAVLDVTAPRFAAQAYHNYLEDVVIRLNSRPQANGGTGTVAYYNSCSEVRGGHDCYFRADTGAVLSAGNPFGVRMRTAREVEWRKGAPERLRMWAAESSMTVVRATGANGLFGITGPALVVAGASDVAIDSCMGHLGHERLPNDPGRWPRYAIEVTGTAHALAHRGSIEGYPGAVRVVGAAVTGLDLRSYLAIEPARGPKGEDFDAVPVVMLDSRRVEHPRGSGTFTVVGSVLRDSHLAPPPTPDAAGVEGRLSDTSADASHVIQGNHLTLGAMSVRVRNPWPGTLLQGERGDHDAAAGGGPVRGPGRGDPRGNVVAAADGVAAATYVRVGAVPALPPAGPEHRGKMVRVEGGDGAADRLHVCERDAAGKYAWRPL